jgi:hypothetical protein
MDVHLAVLMIHIPSQSKKRPYTPDPRFVSDPVLRHHVVSIIQSEE